MIAPWTDVNCAIMSMSMLRHAGCKYPVETRWHSQAMVCPVRLRCVIRLQPQRLLRNRRPSRRTRIRHGIVSTDQPRHSLRHRHKVFEYDHQPADNAETGIQSCDANWQPQTLRNALHNTLSSLNTSICLASRRVSRASMKPSRHIVSREGALGVGACPVAADMTGARGVGRLRIEATYAESHRDGDVGTVTSPPVKAT